MTLYRKEVKQRTLLHSRETLKQQQLQYIAASMQKGNEIPQKVAMSTNKNRRKLNEYVALNAAKHGTRIALYKGMMTNTQTKEIKMNPVQELYAIAKAQYDTINAELKKEMKTIAHLLNDSEEDFEKHCDLEDKIYEGTGYEAARETLKKAEDMLIKWSFEHLKKNTDTEKVEQCKVVIDAALAHRLPYRTNVIDLAFKLSA